jgi:hypothetical protein
MKFVLSVAAVVAVASALPQNLSAPPPAFKIVNVVSGGTGCPKGSIDVNWTDEKVLPICKSLADSPFSNHLFLAPLRSFSLQMLMHPDSLINASQTTAKISRLPSVPKQPSPTAVRTAS